MPASRMVAPGFSSVLGEARRVFTMNKVHKLARLSIFLIGALLCSTSANAGLITIDFGGFSSGPFSSGIEDGVRITGSGDAPVMIDSIFPPPFMGVIAASNICCGRESTFTFSLLDGGLFFFEQVDLMANFISSAGDEVIVEGLSDGVLLATDRFTTAEVAPIPNPDATKLAANLAGVGIDLLKITLRSDFGFPQMDNLILKESLVPSPASLPLLLVGLLAVSGTLRKKGDGGGLWRKR